MGLPNSGGLAKSDKLPVQTDFEIFARKEDVESVSVSYKWQVIGIRIANEKLTTKDVNGLRAYLSQNPITVQYQLAQESIKTLLQFSMN